MLDLSGNELTGSIPTELEYLDNLEALDLSDNQLTGSIPTELGSLINLRQLYLFGNELTDSIPTELGNLGNLKGLWLHQNELTDSIPLELESLSNLEILNLSSNKLTGSIPQGVLDLQAYKRLENPPYVKTEITDVYAPSDENFNLNVSGNFGDINDNITSYSAKGLPNGLTIDSTSGEIGGTPTESGNFAVTVTVSDNARGVVEDEFNIDIDLLNANDYAALKALYTSTSWKVEGWDFSSATPPDVSIVKTWHGVRVSGNRVTLLDLSEKELTGSIPTELEYLDNLEALDLSDNQLTGSIPTELGSLINLRELYLNKNKLTGSIPTELGSLINLKGLWLDNNKLTDSIPTELGSLINLRMLNLFGNELTDSIPTELGNLGNLKGLWLHQNELTDSIPLELESLSNLEILNLSSNKLTGTIPQGVLDLQAYKRLKNPPYVKTEIMGDMLRIWRLARESV